MCRDVGKVSDQHQNVSAQNSACGIRESADHNGHELRPSHSFDERSHAKRGLGLADKNVRRVRKRFGARDIHRLGHDLGEQKHDLLHHAHVVKNGKQGTEENDRDEHLKCKEDDRDGTCSDRSLNDRVTRLRTQPRQVFLQGNRSIACVRRTQRAEYELRALPAEVQQSVEDIIESQKKSRAGFPIQYEETKNELKKESPNDDPPRKVFAVLGDNPRHNCEDDDS